MLIQRAIRECGFTQQISEVVGGAAPGVDTLAAQLCYAGKIPFKQMPAQWTKYGKSAGFRRNEEMALYVKDNGALIAIWNGKSNGTRDMISRANNHGLRVHVLVMDVIPVIDSRTGRLVPESTMPERKM